MDLPKTFMLLQGLYNLGRQNKNMNNIALFISPLVLAGALLAQAPSEVGQRKANQQDRIANGVQSGALNAGETRNLEKKDARINKEIRTDRKANGGNLTNNEKARINKQDNRVSKDIYADKHNAATAKYGDNKVGERRANQQDRIAQGIRSGSLKPGEAAKVENHEAGINHEMAADRKANGGNLTNNQKAKINGQQNKASGAIYKDKHN